MLSTLSMNSADLHNKRNKKTAFEAWKPGLGVSYTHKFLQLNWAILAQLRSESLPNEVPWTFLRGRQTCQLITCIVQFRLHVPAATSMSQLAPVDQGTWNSHRKHLHQTCLCARNRSCMCPDGRMLKWKINNRLLIACLSHENQLFWHRVSISFIQLP